MSRWRKGLAVGLVLCLLAPWAWAQQSTESSRSIRGTGTPGVPADGVLSIQGVLQGRPVTVDFHHTAVSTLHVLAQVAHQSSVVHITAGQSPHVTTFWVTRCGTTATPAVNARADQVGRRRAVYLYNAGTENIFIGGFHATVTATSGFVLHTGTGFTSRLVLENFHGRLDCITVATDSILQVLEIWR